MILIIDDDWAMNEALVEILGAEDQAFQCQVHTLGSEAVKCLTDADYLPDVIMLDMMIPWDESDFNLIRQGPPENLEDWGGIRILEEIRKCGIPVDRVLVISAYKQEEEAVKTGLIDRGVLPHHVLWKPARVIDIVRLVKNIHVTSARSQRLQ